MKQKPRANIQYADDDYESIGTLIKLRTPFLIVGLLLGMGISLVTSRFEEVLSQNIEIAFFIPFIVYIADAVGTQTESIYSRALRDGRAKFFTYLKKESALGIIFGLSFGILAAGITYLWLQNEQVTLAVGIATFFAVSSAPVIALLITEGLQLLRKDPAAGSGPIGTVVQDMASVVIYGIVSTIIIL